MSLKPCMSGECDDCVAGRLQARMSAALEKQRIRVAELEAALVDLLDNVIDARMNARKVLEGR